MSVLKEKRTVSKAEYVNTANQIYVETVGFLTRLSARYSRLIAEGTAQLAGEVMDHTEKANKIYPSDEQRKAQRKAHLLEALASLSALDVRLTHAYLVMYQNPQGCFTAPSGKTVPPKEAMDKLDRTDFSTKGEGHGMGLATVSEILKKHPYVYRRTLCKDGYFIQQLDNF